MLWTEARSLHFLWHSEWIFASALARNDELTSVHLHFPFHGFHYKAGKWNDAPAGIWTRAEGLRVPYAWPCYTTGASSLIVSDHLFLFVAG